MPGLAGVFRRKKREKALKRVKEHARKKYSRPKKAKPKAGKPKPRDSNARSLGGLR
jgi:hypothetical protein